MKFDKVGFNRFVLDNEVVGFFPEPVTLKSGRKSHWYANWRNVAGDAYLLDQLANHVIAFTRDLDLNPDCFYGVPEGATKLGIATQVRWAEQSPRYAPGSHNVPMGRGKPKDHGDPKDRYFLGTPRGETVIIEDVTTTGGSLLETIANVKGAGASVIAALGLTNRMELRSDGKSVQEMVEAMGVPYHALSDAFGLLPEAARILEPGNEILRAVEEEFADHGVRSFSFEEE